MARDFSELVLTQPPDTAVVTTTEGIVVYWTKGADIVCGYLCKNLGAKRFIIRPIEPQILLAEIRACLE